MRKRVFFKPFFFLLYDIMKDIELTWFDSYLDTLVQDILIRHG